MWAKGFTAGVAIFLFGCDQAPRAPAERQSLPEQQFVSASSSGSSIQEGQRLARILGCMGCHKENLQGAVWDDEPEFGIIAPSNLTRSAAIYSDSQLDRMIREGVRPDGSALWEMPSEAYTHLSDADMKALLAYLNSLPAAGPARPRPAFGPEGREEIQAGTLRSAPQKVAQERKVEPWSGGPLHRRGRYIARLACGECHGPNLSGNEEPFRPDLVVASGYSLDEFRRLLRTGEPPGRRELKLMAQVSKSRFSHLTDEEIELLYRYLVARAQKQF